MIAHRGASAYAPEHSLAAYRLAMQQGADYVEQDLQITRDGVLVCLHDLTLERTTNVKTVFPDRSGKDGRWSVSDFTVDEIQRLDAGSWFQPEFQGTRILTWDEAIREIRGKAGIFPETKAPEVYGNRGFDMEKLVLANLQKHGLDQPGADPKTPVILQSFSAGSLKKMHFDLGCKLPKVFLLGVKDAARWTSSEALQEVKKFAAGIGPDKSIVLKDPEVVQRAHKLGLSVTIYTCRSAHTGTFANVRQEMAHYLRKLDVDAIFTDNPDQFPR